MFTNLLIRYPGSPQCFFRRSIFGLIHVYNDLDPAIVEADNVKSFQHKLQALVKDALHSSLAECWQSILSPF